MEGRGSRSLIRPSVTFTITVTEEGSRLAALFLLDLISGAGLVSFSKAHQNLLLVPKSTCYLDDFMKES
jgi:hypothetical protein